MVLFRPTGGKLPGPRACMAVMLDRYTMKSSAESSRASWPGGTKFLALHLPADIGRASEHVFNTAICLTEFGFSGPQT